MLCDTEVCRPLGDLKVTVTTPLVVLSSNAYATDTPVGVPVLGTGEPPSTDTVNPSVDVAAMVVPAAMGFQATALASEEKRLITPVLSAPEICTEPKS